ncbi:Os06g0481700 [Oryza sativa Japonica Group]|uniref:Os06g0481700 protein n=1 Tax=Oryza sativa subsp. japonica TaxID=39947 RepID=A0A0N7KM46_ORYSJ|nr:Os06g0481700 [Oryza sativa Japonica Group]
MRIRHGIGCGHGGDGRLRVRHWQVGGAMARPLPPSGGGCDVGGSGSARLWARQRQANAGWRHGSSTSIADWRRARRRRIRHGTAAGATATGDYG